jgi:hypothetical protein
VKKSKWITKIIKHRRSYSLDFNGYDDENDDYFYSEDWKSNKKTDLYGYINRISSFKNGIAEENYVFHNLSRNTEYEVKIRAKNKLGWSENEPSLFFRTSNNGKYILLIIVDFLEFIFSLKRSLS